MIDFTCLNCGMRVSADDDDAGDQVECPGCTIMLRVPTPIGGRLTEKRLPRPPSATTPAAQPLALESPGELAPPNIEETPARPQRPMQPPEEPSRGFHIEYAFIGVYGRDQMPQLEESVLAICEAAQQHLEALPQFFRSGGLLVEVHRFEVQVGLIDLRLQVRGSLNGEPVSDSIRTHDSPGGNSRSVLMRGVVGVALAGMGKAILGFLSPRSGLSRAYGKAERLASQDLVRCLDNLVNRPRSFWNRMWT